MLAMLKSRVLIRKLVCPLLLCLIFITGGAGCGLTPPIKQPPAQASRPPITKRVGGTPLFLPREDSDCTRSDSSGSLSRETAIIFFDQGKLQRLQVDLGRSSQKGLSGPGITRTTIGGHHLVKANFMDSRPEVIEGEILPFCHPQGGYRRFSLENAALAAAYAIERSLQAYNRVRRLLQAPPLPQVTLLIQPETLEESHSQDKVIQRRLTDNAAWFKGATGDTFYISVMAHSKERNRDYIGKFWEQPAVLSHEYGHHVFYHIAGSEGFLEVLKRHAASPPPSRAEATSSRILHGIEEGFADLFAYYTFASQRSEQFSGRLQFNQTRDIEHPILWVLRGGATIKKRLDHYFLANFTLSPKLPVVGDLNPSPLQDEHALGAVVAYGLNRFYSQLTPPSSLGYPAAGRARLIFLLRWAQAIGKHGRGIIEEAAAAPTTLLGRFLLLAITSSRHPLAAGEEEQSHPPTSCQALARAFPFYYQAWVDGPHLAECRGLEIENYNDTLI